MRIKILIVSLASFCILSLSATEQQRAVGWREDFTTIGHDEEAWPARWDFDGKKFMVPKTKFRIAPDNDGTTKDGKVLLVEANESTGVLITIPTTDLKKYPILRWRWRVRNLPPGADGRTKIDDQVVGIYFGAGGPLSRKSIAYRWETETPIGASGATNYGAGIVKVQFLCIRNKETPLNTWIIEERNATAEFQDRYGYIPEFDEYVVSIAANSQYTDSHTFAEIDYIELVEAPPDEKNTTDAKPKTELTEVSAEQVPAATPQEK